MIRSLVNERKVFRGVIVGIPVNVSVEAIKENITNAKVSEVKCLKTNRTISLCHHIGSAQFGEEQLRGKIYIVYMSYDVRMNIPPPLKFFKCQIFEHLVEV